MEDSCIVDLFLQREEGAIAETASKYGKRLHHFAYGIVENDEDAAECVNDAYLSAWNAIPPHEPRTYLLAFLLRILRHISLDLVRKQHRQKRAAILVSLSEELADCLPAGDLDEMEAVENLTETINGFLADMAPSMRVVFVRRYFYMDSIKAIADACGYSESKVTSMLFRTRKALRKYLEKRGIFV